MSVFLQHSLELIEKIVKNGENVWIINSQQSQSKWSIKTHENVLNLSSFQNNTSL